jgi:hypothetical protein
MDLIHRVRALADEAAAAGCHDLALALHAVANLGGKPPAAVVHAAPGRGPVVVVGPDLSAVLASLGVADPAAFSARGAPAGETIQAVREFRFVE